MDGPERRSQQHEPAKTRRVRAVAVTMAPPTTERGRWWIEGLDAWRALAIISVLIFHLRPGTLPGGFIGVDVFFVISGFLITTLLIRELNKNGRINLPQFWVRRARRLLPALVTVVTCSTIAAFFAGGDLLVGIRRHVLGALTFSNNWVEIAYGSDYFAASTPNLFMNFWSLAVEEQFYLLWPILAIAVMAFLPRGRSRVILLSLVALISALAMALLYSPDSITRVYYGTDTHGFGLMIGAALAFAMAAPDLTFFDTPRWQRLRTPLALGGFAVVVTLMLTVEGEGAFPYRGGLVIASLATAAMVSALPGQATSLTRVLTWAPLEWIGHRSYGIYMWHWPAILIVDAAWPPAAPDSPSWWASRVLALAATLGAAAFSYTHIENPIRKDGFKAVWVRVSRWFLGFAQRARVLLGVAALIVALLFGIALVSAPAMSTLERSMLDAAEFVTKSEESEEPGQTGAPSPSPSDEPGPSGEPEPTQTVEPEPEPPDQPAADISETLTVTPKQIYGVGDSMLYVAAPGMSQALPGMTINAKSNRQWPAIQAEIERVLKAGEMGEVVVIAAGTNAGARDIKLVEQTVEALGVERRIVLVNIFSTSTFVQKTNENYAKVARAHENVEVADWHAAVQDDPGSLQPDKIHPNMGGMHVWANTVTEALERLNVVVKLPKK